MFLMHLVVVLLGFVSNIDGNEYRNFSLEQRISDVLTCIQLSLSEEKFKIDDVAVQDMTKYMQKSEEERNYLEYKNFTLGNLADFEINKLEVRSDSFSSENTIDLEIHFPLITVRTEFYLLSLYTSNNSARTKEGTLTGMVVDSVIEIRIRYSFSEKFEIKDMWMKTDITDCYISVSNHDDVKELINELFCEPNIETKLNKKAFLILLLQSLMNEHMISIEENCKLLKTIAENENWLDEL